MYNEEINDMTTDEEISNRIKETEKSSIIEMWDCKQSVIDAICESVDDEFAQMMISANGYGAAKQLSEFVLMGDKLLASVRANIAKTAYKHACYLETGLLPDGE